MTAELLWSPGVDAPSTTRIGRFAAWVSARHGLGFPPGDYEALRRWSIGDIEAFWTAVWEHFDVVGRRGENVLDGRELPGARWFPEARVNYAEHALRHDGGDVPALIGRSQTRGDIVVSWEELRARVAACRAGLERLGVTAGDRVAAYLPNVPETAVAFLAAASLGAVWTTCAPEFGVQAVLDRFGQIEPTVLLAVDGYRYGSREVDRTAEVTALRAGLPTVRTTVVLDHLRPGDAPPDGTMAWSMLMAEPASRDLEFVRVPFDHPLYVLYSSGTTGLPKPIVHGHGGVLLEHLKVLGLHADLGPADRFTWFTTTGWMMWNYLVSGLLLGSTVVVFDGDPGHPDLSVLWQMADELDVTWFGAGAPFYMGCRKAGLAPGRDHDLSAIRAVGSTGAPLPPEGFRWVYEAVGRDLLLSSISGGTDVCSAFVGGCPLVPVWSGRISCRYLAADVRAFDASGREVFDEQGELVITQPMPSMPVGFWGDDDGSRYRAAYFDTFPGVWRHGDWIEIADDGSCVISGRSDATLNRGGVRIGTAELYRVIEDQPEIADSLIVHLEDADGPGRIVLFAVLEDGRVGVVDDELAGRVRAAIRTTLSPRHVPDEMLAVPAIPTTLSGKKLELPVKKVLRGAAPDTVASPEALRDPTALATLAEIARAQGLSGPLPVTEHP
ncbi:MAG: acetoacetate--CoA ligase [Acidimicrobiia bacterium]|nr:acetoacetate--CoA ligase [Acidimicrobiia bacterium]